MATYQVRIKEVHVQVITVEANSAMAALSAAEEVLSTGINQDGSNLPEATAYHTTLPRSEWDVWQ